MVFSAHDISRRAGLALMAGLLLLAGCDVFGLIGSGLESPSFKLTEGLSARISVLGDTSQSTSLHPSAASAPSVTAAVQVRPPTVNGEVTEASHLSFDPERERLHVGYKIGGDPFGGGIDALSVQGDGSAAELLGAERSLRSTNVDVVEVRAEERGSALYVAGGITTRKDDVTPALLSKVTVEGSSVAVNSTRLSDFVAKGVVLGPTPNTVHVATDENALYQFDTSLNQQGRLTVEGAAGFRSVAAHGSNVFVLDRSGRVFQEEAGAFESLSEVATLAEAAFTETTIARLFAAETRLFAALNQEGFSIFSPTGDAVWTSGGTTAERLYTCVTIGSESLFVGRSDGAIEVYQLPTGVPDSNDELTRTGTIRLWGDVFGSLSSQSINQMLWVEGHLYVAYSTEGLVALRIHDVSASN